MMSANDAADSSNSERIEILATRVFVAAPDVVFKAFADPAQLIRWWGPNGFTNTISEFDLRNGGRFRVVMSGPDGSRFDNEWEFIDIVENERIVALHLGPMHRFLLTMTFEMDAGQTRLTWRMQLEPHPQNESMKPIIIEANEQNFDRLAAHLRTLGS